MPELTHHRNLQQIKKSAIFPSVAFSWFASKKKLFQDFEKLDELKFRFSYGKIGSNPINPTNLWH